MLNQPPDYGTRKKIETNTSTINETIGARAWLQNAPQIITIIIIAHIHQCIWFSAGDSKNHALIDYLIA